MYLNGTCARFPEWGRAGRVRKMSRWSRSGKGDNGGFRRECTGHIVALGDEHLRGVPRGYVADYNRSRCHSSLVGSAPAAAVRSSSIALG